MKKTIGTITSLFAAASLFMASPVLATDIIVSQSNNQNWNFVEVGTDAVGEFVTGPGTPPMQLGSVRLFTGTNGSNRVEMRNPNFTGIRLADITALSYYTYVSVDTHTFIDAPNMILEVSTGVTGGPQSFVMQFSPALNFDQSNSSPTTGRWQKWDALHGTWLISGSVDDTLQKYLGHYPNATIINQTVLGGVGFAYGGIYGSGDAPDVLNGNVDAFTITVNGGINNTYDFENIPVVSTTPTNMDQCKKGGWQNFNNPVFKNQGSCVSFVQANPNAGK